MKDKFWGLKKDEVDRFMKRMDREIQFELQRLEFELVSAKKENERLLELSQELEEKETSATSNQSLWQLANNRMESLLEFLNTQKESEMARLREESDEKILKYKQEITKLEAEVDSINKIIGRYFNRTVWNHINHQNENLIQEKIYEQIQNQDEMQDQIQYQDEIHEQIQTQDDSQAQIQTQEDSQFLQVAEKIMEESLPPIPTNVENEENVMLNSQEPIMTVQEIKQEIPKEKGSTLREEQILDKILSFKEQYISGKVTGKEIVDNAGKIIIPKNTKITKEIVDLANREGRLPELIINLKVTEVGVE